MSERVLRQRRFIRQLKIEKLQRMEEEQEGAPVQGTRAQQRQEEREMAAEGRHELRAAVAPQEPMTCATCLAHPNDTCEPHARTSSSKCHAHVPNMADAMKNLLGPKKLTKARKCTLFDTLKVPGGTRTRRRKQRQAIIRQVTRVVDWIRQVAIKTQCYIQYYVLHKLSHDEELLPSVFQPNCIYGFMQLILGQPITNNGPRMPQDRQQVFNTYQTLFDHPSDCTVENLPGYSHCLTSFKDTIATANSNAVVETFRMRAEAYLAFRLKELIPHEHLPGTSMMKKNCSYLYTRLADIQLEDEPDTESEEVEYAMELLGNIDGLLGPTPINKGTLSRSPHVYVGHLWSFLSEMEGVPMETSQIVDKCDMAWLRMTLSNYQEFKNLTNRRKKRVLKSVLKTINAEDPDFTIRFDLSASFIRELTHIIQTTRQQLHLSKLLLSGDSMIDANLCFKSDSASYTKVTKLFSLLPNFSLQRKFITFNAQQWRHLLAECNIPIEYNNRVASGIPRLEEDLFSFTQTFFFAKARLLHASLYLGQYNQQSPPEDAPYVFDNMIRTDGHTVEFIYATRKSESRPLPDLKMSDLASQSLSLFHVYGVDPGHTHLFTAVDQQHARVRLSNNEWYARSGIKKRRYEEQLRKNEEEIVGIESQIPSRKTSDPENYVDGCKYLFRYLLKLTSFYGKISTKNRFLNYRGQQKMAHETVNIFTSGGYKYRPGSGERAQRGRVNRPRFNEEEIPLLLLGSQGKASMKGKKQSMGTKAIKALKRAEHEGLLIVCQVNEAYTSRVCHLCEQQTNQQKEVPDRFTGGVMSLWSVLQCNMCNHNWDRDYNAASNILRLGLLEHSRENRPEVFTRSMPSEPPAPPQMNQGLIL